MNQEALIDRLLPTLYEDGELLAVAKPAGLDVGGRSDLASTGVTELLSQLRRTEAPLVPVNRLSRFESGVLLLGKNRTIVEWIRGGSRIQRVKFSYVAVVIGRMTAPRVIVEASHGASRGRGVARKATVGAGRSRPAKSSATFMNRDATTVTKLREEDGLTLIRCDTTAPNTHILRAQLRAAGLPLLGDDRAEKSKRPTPLEQTCLHLSGLSFQRQGVKAKVAVKSPPPRGFEDILQDRPDLIRRLHAGLARRLACITSTDTDCYRLLTGPAEGLEGLVAERFGEVVILQVSQDRSELMRGLRAVAAWYRDLLGVRAVYVKRFIKNRTAADPELTESLRDPNPLLGAPVPPEIVVRENDLRFWVRPYDGFSVGLFLDHRENRARVRSWTAGKEVINLFAYTCGFSVAAAAGGAESVVSVDLSPKHLEWGRRNFVLNGLDPSNHLFVRSDSADYVRRAARREQRFDLAMVDAPTFAHGRKAGRSFSVSADLAELLASVIDLLRPEGVLMVSTNDRRLTARGLRERLKLGARGRSFRIIASPPLPVDFAVDPHHSKTLFARFD